MTTPVRTRFAPSPTGYMHIGGMRTALFCWLWARHNNGTFVLRIDDTDQQRNVTEALEPIFRAFRWLGLDWDEGPDKGGPFGPYYQSQRGELYRAAISKLLQSGAAYHDFETPDQIAADRKEDEAAKRNYLSRRRSLEQTSEQRATWALEGKPHVVRLQVPRDRKIAVDDVVRGHVEWDGALMPDPVLARSDGSVLYNFATVVDDAHMQMTHIIRAEEHLTNTAVQVLLHEALGNTLPTFAHIPFITAPGSSKKLSKRDLEKLKNSPALKKMFDRADEIFPQLGLGNSQTLNPVMVEYYERLGYLPAGILNALSRLGWSLDDKTEHLSLATVVENFTLERIVKAPAGFDPEKLQSYQAYWMNQLSLDDKVDGCWPYLVKSGLAQQWLESRGDVNDVPESCPPDLRDELKTILTAIGERLRVFSDILDSREFFQRIVAVDYDAKAFQQRLVAAPEAKAVLQGIAARLASAPDFTAPALDQLAHDFVAAEGYKIGQLVHPLRIAVTGKPVGVSLFDTLAILGRELCVARIQRVIEQIPTANPPE